MLRYGVIGVGHLGRFHAMQAKELMNCNLSSLYDVNEERLNEVSKELSVKAYTNLDEFWENTDAASIVAITSKHFEIAEDAIQRGKHLLIEKPVTVTLEEADRLLELEQKHAVKIQVGHIERFNSALRVLDDFSLNPLFIESHRLAPFNIRGTDVAVILDLMIHDIDLIATIVKSEVKSIEASGMPIISSTEDIANCRIEFENGCIANITASRISSNKMRKMRIFQKNAYLSIDFDQGTSDVYFIDDKKNKSHGDLPISLGQIEDGLKSKDIHYTKYNKEEINPLRNEIQSFVDAIINDKKTIVSLEDGRKALAIAQQILEQIKRYQEKIEE